MWYNTYIEREVINMDIKKQGLNYTQAVAYMKDNKIPMYLFIEGYAPRQVYYDADSEYIRFGEAEGTLDGVCIVSHYGQSVFFKGNFITNLPFKEGDYVLIQEGKDFFELEKIAEIDYHFEEVKLVGRERVVHLSKISTLADHYSDAFIVTFQKC